jgi:Fe2+ or Zn2+ uptake regulation protein
MTDLREDKKSEKLSARLLRTLRDSERPLETPRLVTLCAYDKTNARSQVWVTLQQLEKAGLIRKIRHERRRQYGQVSWELVR